jgi:acyl-CoA synthetase (NDP forming)
VTSEDRPLRALLAPRSVAVVGASDDPDKIGGRPIDFLKRFGFEGTVYPVNPHRELVQGLASYRDVTSLPAPPDVTLIVVPGDEAVAAVEQSAAVGAGAAVVLASGFAETSAGGRQAQDRMAGVAREAGMRLVGPNCQGVTNFANGAVLSFSTMYLEEPPADGPIAVISQSGSMSQVPYAMLRQRGRGVRYCAATGNEADVSALEMAAAVATDPAVHLVLLYLETVRDAAWLAELGRLSAARHLPVIALKAGSTAAGQTAAVSHTGALANEDRVVDAFLERAGIYRAADIRDLLSAVDLHLRHDWKPVGRGVAVVSNSGASCVQAADAVVSRGLHLAAFGSETVARIASVLPSFATPRNPVDVTGALLTNSQLLGHVLSVVRHDPAVDCLLVALPVLGQGYDINGLASAAAEFAATGCPTAVVAVNPTAAASFASAGLPVFATESEAVVALAQWTSWHERSRAAARRQPWARVQSGEDRPGEVLDEMRSLAVLAAGGVPVVAHELCTDADAAAQAWRSLGRLVVLKGCTSRAPHKSDLGLVALGLRTEEDVRRQFERISAELRRFDPTAPGVLVAPIVTGRKELMIGARIDPVFGAVVVVGAGGAYVEAVPDLGVLVAPFDRDEVKAAISRLRMAPILAGVRGEPAADVDAMADAVMAVARLVGERSGVVDVDINPLLVGPVGQGCVAVDATVRMEFTGRRTPGS